MITLLKRIITPLVVLFFIGCSMDVTTITDHPSQAIPGSSYNTSFISSYIYLNDAPRFGSTITRDSIHLAIGLPAGWQILTMNYYAATHFSAIKEMSGYSDNAAMEQALIDSLTVFESRKAPMTLDASVTTRLAHRTFLVEDSAAAETLLVAIDSIDNWQSFSAPLNVTFAANTPTDTFFSGDTSTTFDTIGMSMIPIFFYVTVQTGTTPGDYRLFFFEKTGSMTSNKGTLLRPSADTGSMAMAPISLTTVAVSNKARALTPGTELSVTVDNSVCRIVLGSVHSTKVTARILSLNGTCIATPNMQRQTSQKFVGQWNLQNAPGRKMVAGTYLVEVRQAGKIFSKIVTVTN